MANYGRLVFCLPAQAGPIQPAWNSVLVFDERACLPAQTGLILKYFLRCWHQALITIARMPYGLRFYILLKDLFQRKLANELNLSRDPYKTNAPAKAYLKFSGKQFSLIGAYLPRLILFLFCYNRPLLIQIF